MFQSNSYIAHVHCAPAPLMGSIDLVSFQAPPSLSMFYAEKQGVHLDTLEILKLSLAVHECTCSCRQDGFIFDINLIPSENN